MRLDLTERDIEMGKAKKALKVGMPTLNDAMKQVGDIKDALSPDAPEHKQTPVAPTPDDEAVRKARMRLAMKKYSKAGRKGTALTEGSKLG